MNNSDVLRIFCLLSGFPEIGAVLRIFLWDYFPLEEKNCVLL